MKSNKKSFDLRIEADGKIAINTGDMSGEFHASADEFMKELAQLLGGPVEKQSTKAHVHHHHHGEQEQHKHA